VTASTWRPLAACLLCGALAGWIAQGWRKDASIAELQRQAATSKTTAATALAQATARVLTLERAAGAALVQRADQLTQDQDHAKNERDRFNANVRRGAVRLSIPVASGQCAATADAAAAAGHRQEARAELDPAAGQRIVAIANDGDEGLIALRAAQDYINTVCLGGTNQKGQ